MKFPVDDEDSTVKTRFECADGSFFGRKIFRFAGVCQSLIGAAYCVFYALRLLGSCGCVGEIGPVDRLCSLAKTFMIGHFPSEKCYCLESLRAIINESLTN